MTEQKKTQRLSHREQAEKSFSLIQDIADSMLFSRKAHEAILQAQFAIEEVLWILEEDAAYYEQRDESLL